MKLWLVRHAQPLISSPLQRCERLAQVLRGLRPDLAYKTEVRMAGMNLGCWEGWRWDAIPQADFDRWLADFANHRFGGQESVSEFMQRVAIVWDQTRQQGRDAVWITHVGVIRAATLIARGERKVQQAAQWPSDALAFGGWCELQA